MNEPVFDWRHVPADPAELPGLAELLRLEAPIAQAVVLVLNDDGADPAHPLWNPWSARKEEGTKEGSADSGFHARRCEKGRAAVAPTMKRRGLGLSSHLSSHMSKHVLTGTGTSTSAVFFFHTALSAGALALALLADQTP